MIIDYQGCEMFLNILNTYLLFLPLLMKMNWTLFFPSLGMQGTQITQGFVSVCMCVYVSPCFAHGVCVFVCGHVFHVCVCVCFWVCVWTNLDVCNWSNPPFCHGKAIFLPILPLCAGLLSSLHTKVIYGFIQGKQYSRRTKNTCSSYSNHQIYPHGRMHARNKISYIQKQISTSVLLFCREEELGPWWLCLIWNKWLYWIRSVEGKATWR